MRRSAAEKVIARANAELTVLGWTLSGSAILAIIFGLILRSLGR